MSNETEQWQTEVGVQERYRVLEREEGNTVSVVTTKDKWWAWLKEIEGKK